MKLIPLLEEKYILAMILSGSDSQKETQMERLCSLINGGAVPNDSAAIGQAIAGLFFNPCPRLRRWAFNSIALLGNRNGNRYVNGLRNAVKQSTSEPELLAAAVAALFAISRDDIATFKFLSENHIPVEGALLVASSRYNAQCRADLVKTRVDIYKADPLTLQNVTILIGVNKMPDGVFSDRHPYKEIIGALNGHDDKLVQQYSIWAICENSKLGIADLGIKVTDIEAFPPNVRKWLYKLIATSKEGAGDYREILDVGSRETDVQIRRNVASGLRDTYFVDIEELILTWFSAESDEEVRLLLLEHMASCSNFCASYAQPIKTAYLGATKDSPQRMRLELAAEKTDIYRELRKISFQFEEGLFGSAHQGGQIVVDNSVKITGGNVSIGTLAPGGDFTNANMKNIQEIPDMGLQDILRELVAAVAKENIESAVKESVTATIAEIAQDASAKKVHKLVTVLQGVAAVGSIGVTVGRLTAWLAGGPL